MPENEGLRTRIANTLDDQREKRPGSRDRINEIKDEMDRDVLRTRLADLIYGTVSWRDVNVPVAEEVADAVIAELDLKVENTYLSDDKTRRYVELGGFYGVKADDE